MSKHILSRILAGAKNEILKLFQLAYLWSQYEIFLLVRLPSQSTRRKELNIGTHGESGLLSWGLGYLLDSPTWSLSLVCFYPWSPSSHLSCGCARTEPQEHTCVQAGQITCMCNLPDIHHPYPSPSQKRAYTNCTQNTFVCAIVPFPHHHLSGASQSSILILAHHLDSLTAGTIFELGLAQETHFS